MEKDVRWKQCFANYKKALSQLNKFIQKGELNELEEQGLIQAFEYTYELAWNVIKDYYEFQGSVAIQGSRDAFRMAFNRDLVKDGDVWMQMIESRSKTSHTYNKEVADEIATAIVDKYFDAFQSLQTAIENLK